MRKTQLSVLGEGETGRLKDEEMKRLKDLATAGQIARTKGISHG
jgi:hypothetical protein